MCKLKLIILIYELELIAGVICLEVIIHLKVLDALKFLYQRMAVVDWR